MMDRASGGALTVDETMAGASAPDGVGATALLATARRIYAIRRARDREFGEYASLFRDPAWDIMLDLFIHALDGKPSYAGGAAIASCIPGTTALRCVSHLVEIGLVERLRDPLDGRRQLLVPSEKGMALMRRAMVPLVGLVSGSEAGDDSDDEDPAL